MRHLDENQPCAAWRRWRSIASGTDAPPPPLPDEDDDDDPDAPRPLRDPPMPIPVPPPSPPPMHVARMGHARHKARLSAK